MKTYRGRNLPHIYPVGGVFFITFRLDDSLPRNIINKIEAEFIEEVKYIRKKEDNTIKQQADISNLKKKKFGKYDHQMDSNPYGECQMKDTKVAQIIFDKIMKFDGLYYTVDNLSIMPNHVRLLVDTRMQLDAKTGLANDNYVQVGKWMNLIKGATSHTINLLLGRSGRLWSNESYDHYARDEGAVERIREYILANQVKARLGKKYRALPYLYCNA